MIEAKLGLKMHQRYKAEYYKASRRGSLSESDLQEIDRVESESTLKQLIVQWLERMPFFDDAYWKDYRRSRESNDSEKHPFWAEYREAYRNSLAESEKGRLAEFDRVFFEDGRGDVPADAMRSALFITIYRNLPILHMPFELLNILSEIDELLSNWRYRHFMMVRRMIGIRVGTGGTSGAGYLEGTLSQHYVFKETSTARHTQGKGKLPGVGCQIPN
jgi:tryptophan 2,3-dioxygenase